MLYLVSTKEKPAVNTTNINQMTNKVPCHHEDFFKISSAELYVLQELSNYPATTEQKQMRENESPKEPECEDDSSKLSMFLTTLPAEMNYLQVEEARDWLKQLKE